MNVVDCCNSRRHAPNNTHQCPVTFVPSSLVRAALVPFSPLSLAGELVSYLLPSVSVPSNLLSVVFSHFRVGRSSFGVRG